CRHTCGLLNAIWARGLRAEVGKDESSSPQFGIRSPLLEKGSYSCVRSAYTHSWRGAGPEVGAALVSRSAANFSTTRTAFSRAVTMSSLACIALTMAAISRTLVEGTAEDVAVLMHDAPLPSGIGKDLDGALGEPEACIRDDQSDAGEPAFFEVLEDRAPASLSSSAPSQMPRTSR